MPVRPDGSRTTKYVFLKIEYELYTREIKTKQLNSLNSRELLLFLTPPLNVTLLFNNDIKQHVTTFSFMFLFYYSFWFCKFRLIIFDILRKNRIRAYMTMRFF